MNAISILSDELKSAYAYHKRRPGTRARDALDFARVDVAAGKKRYTSLRDAVAANDNKPGAVDPDDGARWFPKPEACGFRERVAAHDIAPRAVNHTGWYTDQFYDGLCFGLVFLLPGQDGHARAYPAIRFNNTDGTIIYLRDGERIESRHGEIDDGDFHDIAIRADHLAERAAESEREYQERWSAATALDDNIANACEALAAARASWTKAARARQDARRAGATIAVDVLSDAMRKARARFKEHADTLRELQARLPDFADVERY